MNPSDKKKLILAGSLLIVALAFSAWYLLGGASGADTDASAAQQKILDAMPADTTPTAAPETPAPERPAGEPAGRPRSARPGG
jgi:hypothetical protein